VLDPAGNPLPGVAVARSGNGQPTVTAVTNGAGYYAFSAVPTGTYTLKPTLRGATFSPGSRSVAVAAGAAATANFTSRAAA
jgi:Carboxypeptidase regulatory-like domain